MEKIETKITTNLTGGGLRGVECLGMDSGEHKPPSWVRKRISASPRFRLVKGVVRGSDGTAVQATAWWNRGYAVRIRDHNYRIRVLMLQWQDSRYCIGIPAGASVKALPGFPFTEAEVKLILSVADEISAEFRCEEKLLCVDYPVKKTIEANRAFWTSQPCNSKKIWDVLSKSGINLEIFAAALDGQWAALGDVQDVPIGITAFIVDNLSGSETAYISALFRAVNFSTEPGRFLSGPLDLRGVGQEEFENRSDRLSLEIAASGRRSPISAAADTIAAADRRELSGGNYGYRPPCSLIQVTTSVTSNSYTLSIPVPAGLKPLSNDDLDELRTAASRLLQVRFLMECKRQWEEARAQPRAYRVNGFQVWRNLVKLTIVRYLFGHTAFFMRAQRLAICGIGELEAENAANIDAVVDFYRNSNYIAKIRDKSSLDRAMDTNSVSFTHYFSRGKNAGKHVICFTDKEALLETFGKAGLTAALVPEFMRRMDALGFVLHDADGRQTLKVDVVGAKRDCFAICDPRFIDSSEVPN